MNPQLERMIDNALQGGITEREREILISKAISLGIDKHEFELYLENKLQNKTTLPPPTTNFLSCPKCGGQVPVLSKVCPYCEYVFENKDQTTSAQYLIQQLNRNIFFLKTLPKANVLRTIFYENLFVSAIILTIYILILFSVSNIAIFTLPLVVLFPLLFIGGPIKLIMKISGRDKKKFKPKFKTILAGFEANRRNAEIYYGDNAEIKKLISEFTAEAEQMETDRKKTKKNTVIISSIIGFIFLALLFVPYKSMQSDKNKVFEVEMQELFRFNKNISIQDSIVFGEMSKYIYIPKQTINMNYRLEHDAFNNQVLFLSTTPIKLVVYANDTSLSRQHGSPKVEIQLLVTDSLGKQLETLPPLSAENYKDLMDKIRDGKGEVSISFKINKSVQPSNKSEYENYNKIIETKAVNFKIQTKYSSH